MKRCFVRLIGRRFLPCRSGRTLLMVALAMVCSVVAAQNDGDETPAAAAVEPQWLPRPSRFLDRPMTQAEYQYCLRRTDIPKLLPFGPPPGDEPPAPRCLLDENVSVEVNGTVVQALMALLRPSQRLWLAGIRGDSADKVAQLTAKDIPLWQALDRLLEVYGYDWGFAHGAVVCWPALVPSRVRPETPELAPPGVDASADMKVLEIPVATPISEVLDRFWPQRRRDDPHVELNRRPALDERLCDWKLVGRIDGDSLERAFHQVAAALPAVIQGEPANGCIAMGAHMWLDRAIRGADARAPEWEAQQARLTELLKASGIAMPPSNLYYHPLQQRLRALLSAQHWALMDEGGQAIIWFRELPLDVAELWVLTARAGDAFRADFEAQEGQDGRLDRSADWSRPDDFYVRACYVEDVRKSPEDGLYRVAGRAVAIEPSMPTKGGDRRMP